MSMDQVLELRTKLNRVGGRWASNAMFGEKAEKVGSRVLERGALFICSEGKRA